MKYLIKVLLFLLILLLALKLVIHIFDNGHDINYSIGNFNVKEVLKTDKVDNYYFEITSEKININFQLYKNYNKSEKIITKINYVEAGEYKCLLPIFKSGKTLTDIMCVKDNVLTYYRDLKGVNLDKFVEEAKKYGYDKDKYIDHSKGKKISTSQTFYEDNLIQNHYLATESYKGLTLINSEIKPVNLFTNDVYKRQVNMFNDKYYIVADYNNEYTFKKFYVVNIINGNIREIRSYNEISFDSVIEGAVGDDIYIFDKDAETQYKLSLKHETVEKIDGEIKYYNGSWKTMTLSEALEGKTFDNYYSDDIGGYDKVDKLGRKVGYYYLYKKQGDKYLVYRADVQNPKLVTYLFTTTDLNSVFYLDNYIYFKKGTTIYYYCENGTRKIFDNNELEFNEDLKYGVYIKK